MEQKLRLLLESVGLADLPVEGDFNILHQGLDSLQAVFLIAKLEEEFGIKIEAAEYSDELFQSFVGFLKFIEKKVHP